jgi:hypothetical protein
MTQNNDEELFRRSCVQLDLLSPTKSKSVCDAHGQVQTAKTRDGYGLGRMLKEIENEYKKLIREVGIGMNVPKRRGTEYDTYPFFFYVDNIQNALKETTENLHFHVCAYIGKGWTVLRETKFEVSPLVLFPYRYEYSSENQPLTQYHIGLKLSIPEIDPSSFVSKEVTINYLSNVDSLKLKCKFENVPYDSQWSDGQYRQEFVCLAEFEQLDVEIVDDFGPTFRSFTNNAHFSIEALPEQLVGKRCTLDERNVYAPLTTDDEVYCVLYADKRSSVRVLRWLPTTMDDMETKPILPLHELGIIHGEELSAEMTTSGNYFLFGKMKDDEVEIICNMDGFYESELGGFVLPVDLFNFAM